METSLILAWIQTCIAEGRFYIEAHALESHPANEGFTPRQAIGSISRGTLVSNRADDCVCVICGDVPGLEARPGFHENFIHTVINYDRITQIITITMDRPTIADWETPT